MASSLRLRLVLALPFFASVARAVSHTTCKDPTITWWNNPDNENPCQQYEKLRRICDSEYEVPTLNVVAPGDACDSQQSDCCRNSIAFTLSMLCLNCQQGTGGGREGDPAGIDAAHGSYQVYLNDKGEGTNESLPVTVQNAVCNTGLRLSNIHYTSFWPDGAWYSDVVRKEAMDYPAESNKCESFKGSATRTPLSVPDQSSQSAQASETPSQPPNGHTTTKSPMQGNSTVIGSTSEQKKESSADSKSANTALLLGVSLGGFIVVLLLVALILHLLKERRRENPLPVLSITRSSTPDSTASMLESQTASREWTILSEAPTGGDQSSRRAPDSTARVALYHQTSSYAPSSAYNTSDSYSTFIPPASSRYSTFVPPASSRYSTFVPPTSTRSPSPPLRQNPLSDRHKARAPLICQTLDTISSASSDRS